MNILQLSQMVSKDTGVTQKDARKVLKSLTKIIKKEIQEGRKVKIMNFGTFRRMDTKDRRGVNPKTGEPIQIRSKKKVTFKQGKYFFKDGK